MRVGNGTKRRIERSVEVDTGMNAMASEYRLGWIQRGEIGNSGDFRDGVDFSTDGKIWRPRLQWDTQPLPPKLSVLNYFIIINYICLNMCSGRQLRGELIY
jgi:hypothetical protein